MNNEYLINLEREILLGIDFNCTVPTLLNYLNLYIADFDLYYKAYREPDEQQFKNISEI